MTAASSASEDEADGKRHGAKDCWHACDYPSECRWAKRFGLQMPTAAAFAEFDFGFGGESGVHLERVKRKDSGYFS